MKLQSEASKRGVSFLMLCTHYAHLHVWLGSTTMLEAVAHHQDDTSEVMAYNTDVSDGESGVLLTPGYPGTPRC